MVVVGYGLGLDGALGMDATTGEARWEDEDCCCSHWLELDRTYYTKGFMCCLRHSRV